MRSGQEEDKKRVMRIRSFITPSRKKLPKSWFRVR